MQVEASISKEIIQKVFQNTFDHASFFDDLGDIVLGMFAGVRLIGEIECQEGKETYEELRACLDQVIVGKSRHLAIFDPSTRQLCAVFSLYFVWTGIFAYGEESGHDLWPPILRGIGIEPHPNLTGRCGELFMQCLQENGLEQFRVLKTGHPYVTRILLHGLIPDIHTERFINDIIKPELWSLMGIYNNGNRIIDKWCHEKHYALRYLPTPIKDFIEHGMPINADVIDRFLDMARRWEEEDAPDWWPLWGLPKYMVDAFRRFRENLTGPINGRRQRRFLTGEKPYLSIDRGKSNYAVIFVPAQMTQEPPLLKIRYESIGRQDPIEESYHPKATRVEGQFHTDSVEYSIAPAHNGWYIDIYPSKDQPPISRTIHYQFPSTREQNVLPLFFFSAQTGKSFQARDDEAFPEELIVLYPRDASLDLEGGTFLIESEELYQSWKGWRYVVCALEAQGTFRYEGPDITFKTLIEGKLDFRRGSETNLPTLEGNQAPSWMHCWPAWPIFTTTRLKVRCDKEQWKRAVGEITRLDVLERSERFILTFHATDYEWIADLPESINLQPGVYQLQLRGALGVEDVILPFIYLPMMRFETVTADSASLVSHFHILTEAMFDLQPHENTHVEYCGNEIIVSPKTDTGEAFCALRVFAHSHHPVTVLLARSNMRWCRRSESGSFAWDVWRARAEEIPIQRVDELKDARIAIQIDHVQRRSTAPSKRSLRVLLKSDTEDASEECVLMTVNAPTLRRNMHQTWHIDLKQFSEHLKSLDKVQDADISVDLGEGNGELPLFTLLRYPEYKGFQLSLLEKTTDIGRYRVMWTPQPHDPTIHRVLICSPTTRSEDVIRVPLEDRKLPPVDVKLQAPQEAAMWTVHVDIQQSRFARRRSMSHAPATRFTWLRSPEGWKDWLAWPDLHVEEIDAKLGSIDRLPSDVLNVAIPWSYFLTCFYHKKGEDSFQNLISIVGDSVIRNTLPFLPGRQWVVKAGSHTCLKLTVVHFQAGNVDLYECLQGREPAQWFHLPDDITLELRLDQSHKYLGVAGCVWQYRKTPHDKHAIMTSDASGEFEFPMWLSDAIDPSTRGFLEARGSLSEFWDYPPDLPILQRSLCKDVLFPSYSEKIIPYHSQNQSRGFRISDVIDDKSRSNINRLSSQSNALSKDVNNLIERWKAWSMRPDINQYLARLISGRLRANPSDTLTGAAALLTRLKVHRDDKVSMGDMLPYRASETHNLLEETLLFVRSFLPRAFLRDLILSEIFISWYWHKSLAPIGQTEV